jgi:hypothetical protein
MLRHPKTGEQLMFDRSPERSPPIEGPFVAPRHWGDTVVGIVTVILLILLAWGVL